MRSRTKAQALMDLGLPCVKLVGELTPVGPSKIAMSSLIPNSRPLKTKRKEIASSGGKIIDTLIELRKKESGNIEQAALDALLSRAQALGYSRVAEVTASTNCGPRDCEAAAEGVAVH